VSKLTGRSLGKYQIISKIGEGAMGEVYRARDLQLGRAVAIKVINESISHDRPFSSVLKEKPKR
jgi:serine/threonine-protein kinase